MTTIVFVHPSDELYGSDRVLLSLVRRLPPGDRAVVVLPTDVRYDGALSQALLEAGATVHHLRMAVLRRSRLRPWRLPVLAFDTAIGSVRIVRLVRRERADLVCTNTLAVVCGGPAARLARRPHVWHVHEIIDDEPTAFRFLLRALLTLFANRIIANSHATARSVVGRSKRRRARTRVVYPGIEPGPAPERATGVPDTLRVAIVGRLAPRKGIVEGLRGVAMARGRGVDVRLTIAGLPPPGQSDLARQYRQLASVIGLDDVTTFAGFVDDVPALLSRHDVLLVPSQRPEPFGLVVLDGMAAGCAIIATRNGGGSDEIMEDGRTGLYCGIDPVSLADALVRLSADPELRTRLGRDAREQVASRFSAERSARQTLDVLREMVHA